MKYTMMILLALGLGACSKHKDCLKADIFGHCKQWEGYENPCPNPDFLGFCPGGVNNDSERSHNDNDSRVSE